MKPFRMLAVACLALCVASTALAGDHQGWKTTSDVGVATTLAASLITPIARGDWEGLLQAAISDGLAEGIAQLGKVTIHEERPDHSDNDSFPSGHATLAFAAATTLYRRYGWEYGAIAFPIAALTGAARVAGRKHHWWDVTAGAALGFASAWFVTRPFNTQVQLTPWIGADGGGLNLQARW